MLGREEFPGSVSYKVGPELIVCGPTFSWSGGGGHGRKYVANVFLYGQDLVGES